MDAIAHRGGLSPEAPAKVPDFSKINAEGRTLRYAISSPYPSKNRNFENINICDMVFQPA